MSQRTCIRKEGVRIRCRAQRARALKPIQSPKAGFVIAADRCAHDGVGCKFNLR